MREVRKGKIQGKLFCGVFFPQALKEKETLKRKKKREKEKNGKSESFQIWRTKPK